MRGSLSGERLSVVSSVKTTGVGAQATSMEVLGLVCGSKSEKNGPSFSKIPTLHLGMGVGLTFGRMLGVGRRH